MVCENGSLSQATILYGFPGRAAAQWEQNKVSENGFPGSAEAQGGNSKVSENGFPSRAAAGLQHSGDKMRCLKIAGLKHSQKKVRFLKWLPGRAAAQRANR